MLKLDVIHQLHQNTSPFEKTVAIIGNLFPMIASTFLIEFIPPLITSITGGFAAIATGIYFIKKSRKLDCENCENKNEE